MNRFLIAPFLATAGALALTMLPTLPAGAALPPGSNVLPYDIHNAATGREYCQMCAYSSRPATLAAYGRLDDAAFWADLKRLQALHEKFPDLGVFAQVLDSQDPTAIQTRVRAQGLTFPVVYAVDQDWNQVYRVDGISRTVYLSSNFKVAWSRVGLDDAAFQALEAAVKSRLGTSRAS